ncbi:MULTISPECIES: sulfurtransferase [Sutcliffiella]|uniref:sulfurtransferase n=1 Tax=Sutcliffiella TaxID=2837511 RepID=UPI0022DE7619|nr:MULTISPECIES: sulfurtransferase [Sutcliffiella]MED4014762.1 sulfurtransferase [Sutcliffiella cohnii]WBL12869.1 sulfurtransferase [Sutcliffiella sp. NC1]
MSNIINAQWVNDHLNEIVLIDCRFHLQDPLKGKEEYKKEHIPNAFYFDLNKDLSSDISTHGGRHPLPNMIEFVSNLQQCGINNTSTIVAYDDQQGAMASRFWFLLTYLGHKNTFIMKESFAEWKEKGFPTTDVLPKISKEEVSIEVDLQKDLLVTMEDVRNRLESINKGEIVLIDSREEVRYKGIQEPIDRIGGHIPGAVNKFWLDIKKGKESFQDLDPTKEVIVYCGSGVTACPNVLALREAGFHNVKLYAGSWSDWISYNDNPVSTDS